jgi:hypothetical protein
MCENCSYPCAWYDKDSKGFMRIEREDMGHTQVADDRRQAFLRWLVRTTHIISPEETKPDIVRSREYLCNCK